MKTAKQKHAGGRPKKTLADLPGGWAEATLELAAEGGSDVEIRAQALGGISDDLWYRFIAEEPEFSRTIKKAHTLSKAWWMKLGRAGAAGKININAASWIFNMKNRFGWRDRKSLEHSGPGGKPIKTEFVITFVK